MSENNKGKRVLVKKSVSTTPAAAVVTTAQTGQVTGHPDGKVSTTSKKGIQGKPMLVKKKAEPNYGLGNIDMNKSSADWEKAWGDGHYDVIAPGGESGGNAALAPSYTPSLQDPFHITDEFGMKPFSDKAPTSPFKSSVGFVAKRIPDKIPPSQLPSVATATSKSGAPQEGANTTTTQKNLQSSSTGRTIGTGVHKNEESAYALTPEEQRKANAVYQNRFFNVVEDGSKAVVVPAFTVDENGASRFLTREEAYALYKQSGQYFAKFSFFDEREKGSATKYAQDLEWQMQKRLLKKYPERYTAKGILSGEKEAATDLERTALQLHNEVRDDIELERARETFGGVSNEFFPSTDLAIHSGLNQFLTGTGNTFSAAMNKTARSFTGEAYIDLKNRYNDALQRVVAEERSEMGALQSIVFDLTRNTAQNAPAMVMGFAGGGIFGSGTTFASTFGTDRYEMMKQGYGEQEATTYAFFNALNQACLDYLGSMPGLGGISNRIAEMITENVTPAVARTLLHFGINAAGEAGTEWLQSYIEAGLQNAILGMKIDPDALSEEAIYSALLGALSAGAFDIGGMAGDAVASRANRTSLGNEYINGKNGHSIEQAIQYGLNNAMGTEAYQMAQALQQKYENNKSISAYDVGRMIEESQTPQAMIAKAIEAQILESAEKCGADLETAREVAAVAARTGRPIRFASKENMLEGEGGNYNRHTGVITLNAAISKEEALNYVIKHELAHSAERSKLGGQLEQIVRSSLGDSFDQEVAARQAEYAEKGRELSEPDAVHEVVAHWIGNNLYSNGFVQAIINGDASVGNSFLQVLDKARLALGGAKKSRTAANIAIVERLFMRAMQQSPAVMSGGGTQSYINPNFISEYEAWDKKSTGGYFVIGTTSKALESIGINPSTISWDKSKIVDILNNPTHYMEDAITQVPELLENPIVIMQSNTVANRVVLLGDVYDAHGNPVLCALELTPRGRIENLIKIASAYGKESGLQSLIDSSRILYLDPNKKRTDNWLQARRLQLPVGVTSYGSIGRVTLFERNVKGQIEISGQQPTKNPMELAFEKAQKEAADRQYMQNSTDNSQSSFLDEDAFSTSVPELKRTSASETAAGPVQTENWRGRLDGESVVSQAQTMEQLEAELGEEGLYRRLYAASQIDRPPATVTIDGREVNSIAYMDDLYTILPDDDVQLTAYLRERETQKAAELAERFARGETEDVWTELDLQIMTARSKLEWGALDPGEDGKKVRRFYEQRLKGNDTNKAHQEELLEVLAGRSETYNPISNQKTLEKAKERLRDDNYTSRLRKRLLRYKPGDMLNEVDAAAAQVMINDARNAGDLELYADLTQGLSRKGTAVGRAVQILSLQARMTPEGTLRAAQKLMRKQTDKVLYDGASEDLDVLAETLNDAIEQVIVDKSREIKHPTYSRSDIDRNAEYIAKMEPVFHIDKSKLQKSGKRPSELFDDFFAAFGNQIYSEEFGMIALSSSSKKSEIRHGITAEKLASIEAIPSVIQKGKVISFFDKGAGVYRIVIGAPITIGEVPYYMGVMLQRDAQNQRLYLHNVVIEEEIADASEVDLLTTGTSNANDNLYITSILRNALKVKKGLGKGRVQMSDDIAHKDLHQDSVDYAVELLRRVDGEAIAPTTPSREELTDMLVEDIAAEGSPYITKEEIWGILERAVFESSNIPDQLKRNLKKKLGNDLGALAERIDLVNRTGHLNDVTLRRVFEEALNLPSLTSEDVKTLTELTQRMNDQPSGSLAQAEAMEDIYRFLGEKLPVDKWEMLQSWRKFGMLFNVKTHMRNIGSNAVYAGINRLDNVVSWVLERLIGEGERTTALGWSLTAEGQAIKPLLEQSYERALLQMRKQGKYEIGSGQLGQYRKMFGESKVGETLNKASEWNSRMMEKEDTFFFRNAYINALGQIVVARGLTQNDIQSKTKAFQEAEAIAQQRAEEAVFRASNILSDVLKGLKHYQNGAKGAGKAFGYLVDIAIPFTQTPASIAVESIMHTPLGLVKGAYDLVQMTHGKSGKSKAQVINEVSKGVTGSVLFAIGLLLGNLGLFNTGYGKSEKERAADELAGRQENSFQLGNVSISLDWLQPTATPLVVGASFAERLGAEGLSLGSIFGAAMDGTDSLFEMTMLQSLYDILGGYDAGASTTVGSIVENAVSQSVPTLVGQLARAIDPVQRKASGESAISNVIGDEGFAQLIQQVMAKIPGLTYLLEPELDVWGNTVYRTGKATEGNAVLNAFQQFVIPANIKAGTGDDEISQIVRKMYENSEEKMPGRAIPTALDRDAAKELGLSYVEANRLLGAKNYELLEELMNDRKRYTVQSDVQLAGGKTVKQSRNKYWSEMTEDERLRVLQRIYTKEKEKVSDPDSEYYKELIRRLG